MNRRAEIGKKIEALIDDEACLLCHESGFKWEDLKPEHQENWRDKVKTAINYFLYPINTQV